MVRYEKQGREYRLEKVVGRGNLKELKAVDEDPRLTDPKPRVATGQTAAPRGQLRAALGGDRPLESSPEWLPPPALVNHKVRFSHHPFGHSGQCHPRSQGKGHA
jgi:hypothetical protein